MSDFITLKVRLVDKKVFKKFQFYPKKTVKEARLFIAAELEVDPEQYGLFLPPKDDQNGVWFRDDYPLDFYGLEGENEKEQLLFTSKDSPMMEFVEFKKRYRPIKVAKGDNQFKTLMVDDTMNVSDIVKYVSTQVPISSAIDEDQLISMNVFEVEVLSGDMTIREQGYVGECTTNLLRTSKGELNLCVQVPYFEGFMMRKRGGGLMKGLKNWNKRWYSLRKNKLIYYKSKSDNNEMGCILMKTVQAVRPAREVADIPTKYLKMCFEIVTPARTFIMLASNVNEMKKWVEILDFSRRMFAYETHFFGVASKKVSDGPGGLTIGGNRRSNKRSGDSNKNGDSDSDMDSDEEEENMMSNHNEVEEQKRRIQEQKLEKERLEKEEREKEEREKEERLRLEKEEQERQAIEQELQRAEQERQERIRQEREQQEREEQERRRLEEEEMVRLMIEEEERRRKLEEKRQEELKKIQEEQELLRKQQEEFIAKQQQLELEKQRQLQDQLEEDRRLEELMLQMEMDQEERIQKIKEEQERQEQEKLEMARKIKEEEERIKEEQERIRIEQERVEKERQEEEKRMELERQEEERQERERQERIRIEKEERERKEEEERKEKERQRKEEEERIKKEQEEIRLKFELELKEKERQRQEEEERKKQHEEEERKKQEEERLRVEKEELTKKLEQEAIESARQEEERLRLEKEKQDEDENIDMMDEFEREEEEREKAELASKRLRSLQARLEAVSAETPQLKLLLSEAITSSPENLLLSWANYIVSGITSPSLQSSSRQQTQSFELLSSSSSSSSPPSNAILLTNNGQTVTLSVAVDGQPTVDSSTSNNGSGAQPNQRVLQPSTASIGSNATNGLNGLELTRAQLLPNNSLIATSAVSLVQLKNLKSMEANLDMYASLLFKLEPQEFDYQHYQSLSTTTQKAEYIQTTLNNLGITSISTEQLLSNDSEVHLNILLTMYEEVGGGQWEEEFHTQIVSKRTFATKYISQILANSGLGLADSPYDLLPTLLSGRVLCELINKVYPNTIDDKVIVQSTNSFCKKNIMLAYNAAKALNSVEIPDIVFPEKMETISSTVLHNLTWSIVETCLLQSADPNKNRNLFHLLRAETRTSFMQLEREKIMLRWFNYHLRKSSGRSINNFTDDVEDCENYAYLFHTIAPQISRKDEILAESDWEKRAEIVIEMSQRLGCMPLMSARDIVETENSQLNKLFVCEIMRVCPCLPTYQFRLDVEQLDDQVQKSKDQGNNDGELIKWVNGLGIEGVEAKHLLDDFKSGYLFLKVLEKVMPPGTTDSKKFRSNPTSVFKMVELCNYTMEICHKLKLNLAGIAGTDLANGDIRANRAILNQIRRHIGVQTVVDSVISNQSAALKWANSKIHADIKVKSIQSFKDQFLQDGLFLLELLAAIELNSVDRKHIQPGSTEEQQQSNCRYFLSCAWSNGIPLKVLWEDVQKVRSKSIKHIIETLQIWDNQKN